MKSEHPNAARIRAGYEAVTTNNTNAILELFAPDMVLHVPGRSPSGGSWRGRENLNAPFAGLADLTKGTLSVELLHVVADDEFGFALHRHRSVRDGRELDVNFVVVHRFDADGKVVEAWEYPYDLYAFDEQYT